MSRVLALRLASIIVGLLLPLILLELGFQLLPATSGPWIDVVTAEQPIARFQANRDFTWSMLPSMEHVRHGHINNAGFIAATDYVPATHRRPDAPPVVAVIGDSFVEALMAPLGATFVSRLSSRIGQRGEVYGFGISGAPLSQYLAWADNARRQYRPELLIVSVVSNDFDESILDYKLASDAGSSRGFQYFVPDGDRLALSLIENRPSLGRRLARSSALIRYFYMNAGLRLDASLLARLGLTHSENPLSAPALSAVERRIRHQFPTQELSPLPEREPLTRRAVDAFLAELPARAGLPPARIILTVDALCIALIDPTLAQATRQSLFGRMRSYLMAEAHAAGFTVVDLDAPMRAFVGETGQPVEYSDDYHWNEHGHRIVADAIAATAPFRKLFDAEVSRAVVAPRDDAGTRLAR